MNFGAFKLGPEDRVRAAALESEDVEAIAWYAAYLESELRCPECGCATWKDAERTECGCDAPCCARDGSQTLAEAFNEIASRAGDGEQG